MVKQTLLIDRAQATPIYRQIYLRMRQSIADGRLRAGDRVPAVRALAAELNLARGTVEAAYQQLIGEGYLIARGPAGTVVSPQLDSLAATDGPIDFSRSLDVSSASAAPLSLQIGLPALDAFPRKLWNRLLGSELRSSGTAGLIYPEACGYAPLRAAVAAYLGVSRGIACVPAQVFICAGYRACLELAFRSLMKDADQCWFEEPGYFVARRALLELGVRLVPVPVDTGGLNVAAGIKRAKNARFAVVTPTHQSPLGVSLSLPRRLALLDWAMRQQSWIIEDDYDSEYRYVGRPLPAMKSLDEHGRVLYAGSFSKVLFPGLRLAYLVVPQSQAEHFAAVAESTQNYCPYLLQATVARFMADGHFGRHLKRMRGLYAQRRRWLIEAMHQHMPDTFQLDPQAGGMHLLGYLESGSNDGALADRANAKGMAVVSLSSWYAKQARRQGLVLGFTNVASQSQADMLARRLSDSVGCSSVD